MTGRGEMDMEEKNKPGETVPEPGESERISETLVVSGKAWRSFESG